MPLIRIGPKCGPEFFFESSLICLLIVIDLSHYKEWILKKKKDCKAEGGEQYRGIKLFLLDDFYAWRLAAILTAASVPAASSFRNVQGIRIIPAIPTRASASIINSYHFLVNIVHIRFMCEDRLGVPMRVIQLHRQQVEACTVSR